MMRTEASVPAAGRSARWLASLDAFQVQFLILDAQRDRALLDAARAHPAWMVDYEDGDSVLLARSAAPAVSPRAA